MFRHIFFIIFIILSLTSAATAQSLKDLYAEATKAFQQGRHEQAIVLYQEVVALNPKFPQAHNMLGMAYQSIGDIDRAARSFELAVGLDPQFDMALKNLCRIYYKQTRFQEAIEACGAALKLDPDFFEGNLSMGWAYLMGMSKPRKAITFFNKTLAQQEIPMVHYGLGLAYIADDQRVKVFDSITRLKQLGLNEVAERLEFLLREDRDYVLKKGGKLVEETARREPFSYRGYSEEQIKQIPVRLKSPDEQLEMTPNLFQKF